MSIENARLVRLCELIIIKAMLRSLRVPTTRLARGFSAEAARLTPAQAGKLTDVGIR